MLFCSKNLSVVFIYLVAFFFSSSFSYNCHLNYGISFSYGTLQLPNVQLDIFGRILNGRKAKLYKYVIAELEIMDEDVILKSGKKFHPIAKYTGKFTDYIEGVVFEVTFEELVQSDSYEVEQYQRKLEIFDDGTKAWVYVHKDIN